MLEKATDAVQNAKIYAKRQAVLAVVHLWTTRLALVSGITTFFVSMDSLLFSLSSVVTHVQDEEWSAVDKLTTACFAGALILHICSAIISFMGSFALVRLQLLDADQQEVEAGIPPEKALPLEFSELGRLWKATFDDVYSRVAFHRPLARRCSNESLLDPGPPVELLACCSALAVVMTGVGFILAVVGILTYVWTVTPLSIGIFTSACFGGCILTCGVVSFRYAILTR
ncbi:predicted protein [Sparassis crispa]|uniref:Transmembrane protein n=1 Tax=Sparassis crispa TaxID=139825 RepID=A0A401GEZ7_9APHY|nr:predicted protein [Sparassis crispa]GBE80748.1 predicted protein [Sparassis crispa]